MGEATAVIREDITQTRERMGETLDAIGYRVDIPARARDLYVQKPAPVIGGGAGLVALIAGIVTMILLLRRRGRRRRAALAAGDATEN